MRIMTRQVILAAVLAAMPVAAQATVYFNNQFETETPNTASGVPNAGYNTGLAPVTLGSYNLAGGMTLPTAANNRTSAGGRGAAVHPPTAGFATQSVGLFTHPFQYGGGQDAGMVMVEHAGGVNDALAGTTTGQYVFSFDMSVTNAQNTSTWNQKPGVALLSNYFGIGPDKYTYQGNETILNITQNGSNFVLTSADGAGLPTDTVIFTGLTLSRPYNIAATLDMDTRTFKVAVDGVDVGTTFTQMVNRPTAIKGIGEYRAVGGKPDTASFEGTAHFLDNISLQSVPEPVSLSSLGLGAMLLLRRRTKNA